MSLCDKVQYDSHLHAMQQVPHLNKRTSRKHRYQAYRCKECGKWHLTTITKLRPVQKRMNKYPFRYDPPQQPVKKNKRKRDGGK